MHGYEVNATLDDRKIREWAPVSRPQIYYSLDKLVGLDLVRVISDSEPAAGPERRVLETTAAGRDRLAEALEQPRLGTRTESISRFSSGSPCHGRRADEHISQTIEDGKISGRWLASEKRSTLEDVLTEVGHLHHEAVWMLELKIGQSKWSSNGSKRSFETQINGLAAKGIKSQKPATR